MAILTQASSRTGTISDGHVLITEWTQSCLLNVQFDSLSLLFSQSSTGQDEVEGGQVEELALEAVRVEGEAGD